ncbi:MAG: hypothetical protein ABH803_01135 [Candidatus Micrarchaeota archaeon]
MDIPFLKNLFEKKQAKQHSLKWGLPEQRLTGIIKDAEKTVYALKKNKAAFISGGEFIDVIHAKQLAPQVFTYFIVRTEKKTEKETILFDGYMAQEDENIDLEVQSSYSIQEDLDKLGYQEAFARAVTEWQFKLMLIKIKVLEIDEFGCFIEIALPKTKMERTRKNQEKQTLDFLEKLGVKKEEIIPTDVITIQMMESVEKQK